MAITLDEFDKAHSALCIEAWESKIPLMSIIAALESSKLAMIIMLIGKAPKKVEQQ